MVDFLNNAESAGCCSSVPLGVGQPKDARHLGLKHLKDPAPGPGGQKPPWRRGGGKQKPGATPRGDPMAMFSSDLHKRGLKVQAGNRAPWNMGQVGRSTHFAFGGSHYVVG